MHEFIFDGVSSSTFNAYVASSNFLDGASRDIQSVEIPGRSGNVILDNGRYNNFAMVVNVYIRKDIAQNAQDLKAFLLAHCSKYYTFEDSFAPDVFRMARFTGEFVVETFDHQGGVFALEFDCKPQRFLKSGLQTTEITGGSGTISNPTFFESSPLLKVYGYGTVGINDQAITITDDGIGYLTLADRFTLGVDATKSVNVDGLFEAGDYITFESGYATVKVRSDTTLLDATVSVSGTLAPLLKNYNVQASDKLVTLTFSWEENQISFPSSGRTNQSVTFNINFAYSDNTTGLVVCTLVERLDADAQTCSAFTAFISSTGAHTVTYECSAVFMGINGISTVGGSWPFMVDLDSLKAYKDTGGQVVNLNHLVEYGTEAPTLQPGENEITSDTYPSTQVDILPRWWTL